jgi:hypothetical protein
MTVSIEQSASQADPTTTSPLVFDVLFSKAVSDFDTSDVSVTSTSGETLRGVVSSVSGSLPDKAYSVEVDVAQSGTVTVSIGAGAATSNGRTNLASTSVDNHVVFRTKLDALIDDVAAIEAKLDDESRCNQVVVLFLCLFVVNNGVYSCG